MLLRLDNAVSVEALETLNRCNNKTAFCVD